MPIQQSTETAGALIEGGGPTIYVSDLERAVRFYTETLGLRLLYRAADKFAMVDAGAGLSVGLHPASTRAPAPGTHGSINVGFNVAGPIEQAVAALRKRGVVFRGPVVDDGGAVKLAFFGDPDGNDLYLCQVMRW